MRKLVFNKLTMLSDTTRCGGQFELSPTVNLITSSDNSEGKSSLVKNFFWTLGCEPGFDHIWDDFNVKAILDFSIDEKRYRVARQNNQIWICEPGESWRYFSKITGAYSKWFSQLVGFEVLLPNRSVPPELETPPPAFFFLPYYIDQRRSWLSAWRSFDGLAQYAKWEKTIIGYHAGYLDKRYFEYDKKIALNNQAKKVAEDYLEKCDIVTDFLGAENNPEKILLITNPEQVETFALELSSSLSALQKKQEVFYSKIAALQIKRESIVSQLEIAKVASAELHKDYNFAVENIPGDVLVCPVCGTEHDNSLVSRASILADRDMAASVEVELSEELVVVDDKIGKAKGELSDIKISIEEIQDQCQSMTAASGLDVNPDDAISVLASSILISKTNEKKQGSRSLITEISRDNRGLSAQRRKLLSKEDKEVLDQYFSQALRLYFSKLSTGGVAVSPLLTPLDYKRLENSGGAAESVRGLLAYYLSILDMTLRDVRGVVPPFVVDTPNQHDQLDAHYVSILELLMDKVAPSFQLVLCAMDRKDLNSFKEKARVTVLDGKKLLRPEHYDDLADEFEFMKLAADSDQA